MTRWDKVRSYTVMILPNPTARTLRFSVSGRAVRYGAYAIAALGFLGVVFFFQYLHLLSNQWELRLLRQENSEQKQQIRQVAGALEDLKGQMTRLKEFDAKLRVITNLEAPKEGVPGPAVGGQEVNPSPPNQEKIPPVSLTVPAQPDLLERLRREVETLKAEASVREASLLDLTEEIQQRQSVWASTPSIWPIRGWLTSGFGQRVSPFTGLVTLHRGVDVAAPPDTPVIAPAAGIIAQVGYDDGLGRLVKISHGYGIMTEYGHLSRTNVHVGQKVKRGDVIAFVGNTGMSTGPHLHYEVHVNQVPVNPLRYVLN